MQPDWQERYSRQILFAPIGEPGQQKLLASSAVLIGCGALGTAVAELLVRAGLGRLRMVDRDFVEPSNLQRQTLFDESDALQSLPKAVAAERKLRAINSGVAVEGVVADLTPRNAETLLGGVDLILDGTDNFETRWLINDFAVQAGRPWIYAAVVGSYGLTLTIRPGLGPCLACLVEARAGLGHEATCDTVGVLNSAVSAIAALEAAAAVRLLVGASEPEAGFAQLIACDVWEGRFQTLRLPRNPDCAVCVHREFRHLQGTAQPHITLCGRDSVQIHERTRRLDLAALSHRLAGVAASIRGNEFLLRFSVAPYELTVFADGRAIIKGTRDPAVARSLYARYIGA
ncbi:MAG: ThiF family adenylyltransferase [Firmicutes bacterium]|nr:ThiF family adenylyltransferase [Bacillota bacterium]